MLRGSMVAMITPMKGDGAVDQVALKGLIEFHVEQGTDAIVMAGTTGESATLMFDEHIEVIHSAIEIAAGRIPIIAGTGANSTQEAIDLTSAAKEAGADACLLVTPYYNKPTQEGLYLHFRSIAEAADVPQILYNVPGRTACDMSDETVIRLSKIPNIVGLKDATGDLGRIMGVLGKVEDGFLLLSGDDATGMEFMLSGGHGVISVTSNVAPAAMHEMCEYALAGNRAAAEAMNNRLLGLHRNLFVEANPIPVKWAMAEMGRCEAGIRLPLTWLSESCHDDVRVAMQRAGVL